MKHFRTINEFHQFRQLPQPRHPLISVINIDAIKHLHTDEPLTLLLDFYCIAIKRISNFKVKYGQQQYDFDNGIMSFMAPNQVYSIVLDKNEKLKQSGWVIFIHPDFLWNTTLAQTIKQYDFWDYFVNEALFLSEKEEATVTNIIQNIQQEYCSNIDRFTKKIITSHVENLLNYAERFYHRQFITREKTNHQILERLEKLLTRHFADDNLTIKGLPSVKYVSEQLNLSPGYLSSLLRVLTGQNTQQHIHGKLIEKAKEKLSATNLSVSEIAYELGFEHLQSFSKFFKTKTEMSPLEFRKKFN
ncbi:helix-turn-helix domain-containing protein [Chitinophaga japonensis]|uniref:Transcriptional regulator, AraC family n=1 Tax=Chitinophaga japonensis TaxID=104662 RepID=A0A562ST08_CHIJA|nr:AraC family transcriptional regulator [Chitinophaga japonensis]TWI84238.1 transcriptional regulator, AraC family [Chitinophaga japonensis]